MASIADLWNLVVKVDRLLKVEDKHAVAIAKLQDQIDALTDGVTRLETREEVLLAEAKAAAGIGAMTAMAEIARRVGSLEAKAEAADQNAGRKRLPKPTL